MENLEPGANQNLCLLKVCRIRITKQQIGSDLLNFAKEVWGETTHQFLRGRVNRKFGDQFFVHEVVSKLKKCFLVTFTGLNFIIVIYKLCFMLWFEMFMVSLKLRFPPLSFQLTASTLRKGNVNYIMGQLAGQQFNVSPEVHDCWSAQNCIDKSQFQAWWQDWWLGGSDDVIHEFDLILQ